METKSTARSDNQENKKKTLHKFMNGLIELDPLEFNQIVLFVH